MKFSNIFLVVFFGLFLGIIACNSKKEDQTQAPPQDPAATELSGNVTVGQTMTAPSKVTKTTIPDGSVIPDDPNGRGTNPNEFHFKCPNNCEGGGAANAGKCPVCGTELVHNPLYHRTGDNEKPGSSAANPIKIDPNSTTGTINSGTQTKSGDAAAAKNAKGEWHYVCSKACGGGGASAGNCPKCGSPLNHNQAYHQ